MSFRSFRELTVWQKSVDLTVDVYGLTRSFPREEVFGMTAQMRRAALSISNDIAEGHGRATRGEFRNFLSAARGSANEAENCLLVSNRLDFAADDDVCALLANTDEVQRMLVSLRASLRR